LSSSYFLSLGRKGGQASSEDLLPLGYGEQNRIKVRVKQIIIPLPLTPSRGGRKTVCHCEPRCNRGVAISAPFLVIPSTFFCHSEHFFFVILSVAKNLTGLRVSSAKYVAIFAAVYMPELTVSRPISYLS